MIGKKIAHYRVIESLGSGGMGVVYKAEDTKLKRTVALKFLPPELVRDEAAKERFLVEARAAAALDHKNICSIYEINDTDDGQMFIAMAHYEGDTLKQKKKEGPLKLNEALDIAIQIAEGLDNAHSRNIVHRDIKPANIIITQDGLAKILDFGLAKLKGQSELTRAGTTLGTTAYMSPEQALGQEVDQRSDIWSLGIIIYQMLTGQLPFRGEYEQSIIYSIINEEPEALTAGDRTFPGELDTIIKKSLTKKPEKRYQNIRDLLDDLKNTARILDVGSPETTSPPTPAKPSIAVLPFTNMSVDTEQEYFCDGMTEEIINALTHVENLHVVARTSTFFFKGKQINLKEVARELNVKFILEGSVRKAGNRLRITAQLIKVADGYHLWSEKFDRNMEDVFAIQDEISLAIVKELKIKLLAKEKEQIIKINTHDIDAYNLYLRGKFYWEMSTAKGYMKAREYFELALKRDSKFAMPYVGLGMILRMQTIFGNVPPKLAMPKMREYAQKALDCDQSNSDALCLLAMYYITFEWNWYKAEKEIKEALDLNPNSSTVYIYLSILLTFSERNDEAVEAAKKASEIDPLSDYISFIYGQVLSMARRLDEAIRNLELAIKRNPNYFPFHYTLGECFGAKNLKKEAVKEYEKAYQLSGGVPFVTSLFITALHQMGDKNRAEKLKIDLEARQNDEYIPSSCFYLIHRVLGNRDLAHQWLDRAFDEHDSLLGWFVGDIADLANIPPDPYLLEKMKKMGLKK